MNEQSAKSSIEDDDDGSAIAIDRLSQLPQPILHSILSLLSQEDAIRTCVLSKSWRYLWHGRFNVEFRDIDYCFDRKEEIWPFIDKTLQRYLDQNFSLQKFLVEIFHYEVDVEILQKWIPIVIMHMGVRSFNLIFRNTIIPYPLPLVVFQSESLVELRLQHCDLDTLKSTENVMFKNLQTLRLNDVCITDEIFDKIISSCPLIEYLGLSWCTFFTTSIKLPKHCYIKKFRCMLHEKITIEFENPQTLETVHIRNCWDLFFCHRNTNFPHLKSLKLDSVQLCAETFDNFSSLFPCLNELVLHNCDGLKEFCLLSSSIKRLTIINRMDSIYRGKMMKAFIDTPNILYFEYSDDGTAVLPSIKFTATSNQWKSQITLSYRLKHLDNDATSWFFKLNKLLKALSQSRITLSLFPYYGYKKLHINDSYGGFTFDKPVAVEHLVLSGCRSSSFDPVIINCFFRICRPRYIHMDVEQANCNHVEYITKLIPDETGCYFGLQDLEEVREMKANEWHCVEETSFPLLHFFQQLVCFQLTWIEQ